MQRKFFSSLIAFISVLLLVGCGTTSDRRDASLYAPKDNFGAFDFSKDISVGQEDISLAAIGLIGVPYRWGGNTPEGGFDCSGLVAYVFANTRNFWLPRTTAEMPKVSKRIDDLSLAPGDLVFFNTLGTPYSHVGIYIGKGRFVHAPNSGGTVRLERMTTPYWISRFTEARRIASLAAF